MVFFLVLFFSAPSRQTITRFYFRRLAGKDGRLLKYSVNSRKVAIPLGHTLTARCALKTRRCLFFPPLFPLASFSFIRASYISPWQINTCAALRNAAKGRSRYHANTNDLFLLVLVSFPLSVAMSVCCKTVDKSLRLISLTAMPQPNSLPNLSLIFGESYQIHASSAPQPDCADKQLLRTPRDPASYVISNRRSCG